MRPIKLEISGLQSFSKKQVVNFDELTSLGIFGIFGETGSGKSTILDAMIFAIFDEIPRTMGNKGKNIRPSLNHDSDILEVYFKFALGENIFEITRTYKKKYSRKGEEKFEQQNPILILNGDVIADTTKNVEGKISEHFGINVQDFTRSVVLPQGKFSEFLKLKGGDKMTMLENIFDLEKYGKKMSERIKIKSNKIKEEINSLENQIKGKGDCSKELIETLKENLLEREKEYNKITFAKNEIEKKYNSMKNIKSMFENLEEYKKKMEILNESKDMFSNFKIKLEENESAKILKILVDEIDDIEKDLNKNSVELNQSNVEIFSLNKSLKSFQEKENILDEEFKNILKMLENFSVDYDKLDNFRRGEILLRDIESKKNQITENKNISENISEEIFNLEKKLIELNQKLEKNKKDLDSLEKINEEDILKFDEEIKKLQNTISNLEMKFKEKEKFDEEIEKIKIEILNGKIKKDELEKEFEILNRENIQSKAFEIAKTLVEGEMCPVCGGTDHPNLATENFQIDLDRLEKLSKNLEKIKSEILLFENKYDFLFSKLTEINKLNDLENIEKLKDNLKTQIVALNNLKDKEKAFLNDEKQFELNILELETEIKNINLNISDKKNYLKNIMNLIKSNNGEIEKENLKLNQMKLENLSLEEVSKEKNNLENMEKEQRGISTKKDKVHKEILNLKDETSKINSKLQNKTLSLATLEERVNILKSTFDEKNTKLNKLMIEANFYSKNEIAKKLLTENEVDEIKTKISNYENNLIKFQGLVEETLKNIGDNSFDENEWKILSKDLDETILQEKEIFKDLTKLKSEVARVEKLRDESKELMKEIDKLTLIQDDILMLSKKFEGKKFVRFLARKKLDYIAYEASKRLQKITKGRYLLTVDNNCDFNIVDMFNGNFTRETATLSGGETFIVSLVLALALSSQLQLKGKVQLEFFFLDEGFGTLDSTLLDKVINILEEIRWEDKINIGIISHVEDLKIRIPRRLEVTASVPGVSGSTVKLI